MHLTVIPGELPKLEKKKELFQYFDNSGTYLEMFEYLQELLLEIDDQSIISAQYF